MLLSPGKQAEKNGTRRNEGCADNLGGGAYGIRLGLFAGVRTCPPRAYFLVSLFTADRSVLLEVVGVAVQASSWHCLMTLPSPAKGTRFFFVFCFTEPLIVRCLSACWSSRGRIPISSPMLTPSPHTF